MLSALPGKLFFTHMAQADSESWNDELNFYGWSIEVARSSKLEYGWSMSGFVKSQMLVLPVGDQILSK